MGYKAEEQVDQLDYDFAPYVPEVKGTTPEPTSEQIKQYLLSFQAMMRRQRDDIVEWQDRLEAIKGNDAEARAERARLEEEYASWQSEQADKRLGVRRQILAMLCSDKPSVEDLEKLPGRLFDDFEGYMQNEIGPKGLRSGSN